MPTPTRDVLPRLSQLEALSDAIIKNQEVLPRIEMLIGVGKLSEAQALTRELTIVWQEAEK